MDGSANNTQKSANDMVQGTRLKQPPLFDVFLNLALLSGFASLNVNRIKMLALVI